MEKVSIVIPVYNGSDYLDVAIQSALAQTWENYEVIVVNDGSDDHGATASVAERYQDRITYYEKRNGGTATALNYGIERMKGTYFSWLSHDDIYLPNKLRNQMKLLDRQGEPNRVIVGNYALVQDWGMPYHIMDFQQLYGKRALETPLFPVFHCAVNGCTLLIHKSHFDRVGLFREDLKTTQDYDMWFRMFREQSVTYSKGVDVVSRVHPRQTSVRFIQSHEDECTELWLRLFNSLTDQEKKAIGGNKDTFYSDMYNHFRYHTSYQKVAEMLGEYAQSDHISLRRQETGRVRLWNKMRMQHIYYRNKALLTMHR